MITLTPPQSAPTDPVLQAAQQVLRVKPTPPRAWPTGTVSTTFDIEAPAGWPDGPRVPVTLHRRGEGPAALLVHGWQSQAADLMPLGDALIAAGFSVWAPDLPGHGHSGGQHLAIPQAANALREIGRLAGPFALAIGHSYGGASLVHALAQGLAVQRVVLLAAPTHYGQFVRLAARQRGLDAAQTEALLARLHEVTGEHPDRIDMARQAEALSAPALLMHSADDTVVPAAGLHAVAQRWRGARWHPLEGLGHFRLLDDPGVLQTIRRFAAESPPPVALSAAAA